MAQRTNAMTVDVEDYFQVSAFENHVPRDQWDTLPSRVEQNTDRILELFDHYDVQATFFVLGWIAERFPGLLRRICDCGHEIGSHGFSHIRATTQRPEDFRKDVQATKNLLEDVSGVRVNGYRAASFSIGESNMWALQILGEVGYRYSSSIYPVRHDLYGMPAAPRFPFEYGKPEVLEIPISTVSLLGRNWPCGGGGYFRLLPYFYYRWAIGRINEIENQSAVFYFHPWEIDPSQPKQSGLGPKARFRHYFNLGKMETRLRRLMEEFRWGTMESVYLAGDEKVSKHHSECVKRLP